MLVSGNLIYENENKKTSFSRPRKSLNVKYTKVPERYKPEAFLQVNCIDSTVLDRVIAPSRQMCELYFSQCNDLENTFLNNYRSLDFCQTQSPFFLLRQNKRPENTKTDKIYPHFSNPLIRPLF